MKLSIQQPLLVLSDFPTLRSAPYGEVLKIRDKYLMRVKPTQFLLNSTLVSNVLNRGDCFVVNMETGTLYILQGSEEISVTESTMHIVQK
jgi:hypothetical protein